MEKFHFSTFQGDTSNCSRAQPASTSHLAGEGWVCPRFQSGIGVSQQKKRSFYSIKSSQQCLSPRGCARAGPGDASDPLRGAGTGLGLPSCIPEPFPRGRAQLWAGREPELFWGIPSPGRPAQHGGVVPVRESGARLRRSGAAGRL